MKNIVILFFVFLFVCSCSDRPNLEIKGKAKEGTSQKLVLEKMSPEGNIRIDSVLIGENEQFEFKQRIEEPTFFLLKVSEKNFLTLLVEPGEKVNIETSYKALSRYSVDGSEGSKLVNQLTKQLGETLKKIDSLNKEFKGNHPIDELEKIRANLFNRYNEITENHKNYIKSFVEENKSSLASIMALYQQYDEKRAVLDRKEDLKYFVLVDSVLIKKYPASAYVRSNHQSIAAIKKQIELRKVAEDHLALGAEVPDIALPDSAGDTIRLSELKGKYVLIDFWAAWSEPSRKANKDLKQVYEKYKDKGFEIYQVSLDRSKKAWLTAIEEDELVWINVSDLQFWSSIAAKKYKIEAIPANILVNPEGKVAGRDLYGEKLDNSLGWFIKNVPPKKK